MFSSILKPCPASGEGVHKWVYYAACTLVEAGLLRRRRDRDHRRDDDALS